MRIALVLIGLLAVAVVAMGIRILYEKHARLREYNAGLPPNQRITVDLDGLPRIDSHFQLIIFWKSDALTDGKATDLKMVTVTSIGFCGFGTSTTDSLHGG